MTGRRVWWVRGRPWDRGRPGRVGGRAGLWVTRVESPIRVADVAAGPAESAVRRHVRAGDDTRPGRPRSQEASPLTIGGSNPRGSREQGGSVVRSRCGRYAAVRQCTRHRGPRAVLTHRRLPPAILWGRSAALGGPNPRLSEGRIRGSRRAESAALGGPNPRHPRLSEGRSKAPGGPNPRLSERRRFADISQRHPACVRKT